GAGGRGVWHSGGTGRCHTGIGGSGVGVRGLFLLATEGEHQNRSDRDRREQERFLHSGFTPIGNQEGNVRRYSLETAVLMSSDPARLHALRKPPASYSVVASDGTPSVYDVHDAGSRSAVMV